MSAPPIHTADDSFVRALRDAETFRIASTSALTALFTRVHAGVRTDSATG